jgi:hypothetical protein
MVNYLLDRIPPEKADIAKVLRRMIKNGEDPAKVLIPLAKSKKIDLQKLSQIKNYYNIARKFGLKHQVPNEIWIQAEQAIRTGMKNKNTNTNNNSNGFKGF